MKTRSRYWTLFDRLFRLIKNSSRRTDCAGQALVEFTLCFVLLIVIAWIPADFGLMFYTGHIGQNAAREGARVAAADPTLPTTSQTCTYPCASGSDVMQRISNRVAAGLMASGAIIDLANFGSVTTYYPTFYKILRFMRFSVPDSVLLDRRVRMRYEHQC